MTRRNGYVNVLIGCYVCIRNLIMNIMVIIYYIYIVYTMYIMLGY